MTDDDIVEHFLFGQGFPDVSVPPVIYDELDAALWLGEDASSDESPKRSQSNRKKRQRLTLKQEIEYLREKQTELQGRLDQLETNSLLKGPVSVWEARAKNQMAAVQRAIQENTELRNVLQEQLKTAQALERVLKRKPKLELSTDMSAQEWRMLRLGTDRSQRLHAMRAITEHVYGMLESEFIKSQIYDLKEGQSGMSVRTVGTVLWFDFIHSSVVDVEYDIMQSLIWSIMCRQIDIEGDLRVSTKGFSSRGEMLEFIYDNMAYIRADTTIDVKGVKAFMESRWIIRKYVEENRTVFVSRTILDDALFPHAPDRMRDNIIAWIILERHPTDPSQTQQHFLLQCTPASYGENSDEENAVLMPHQGEMTEILLNIMRNYMESVKTAVTRNVQSVLNVKLES
ncbi:hypothetical protein Ae201684P_017227 [Aphanomyces euteiches]|uniref:Uncharacterized protein n=1 Tax=Aphanomyces euteiches TaxID=100861 RepID=A0A6G0W9I1_9STRA|nr:hypothetical protein Ae201684_017346 [Aphanomyces euteiches]KAH9088618.1 hypothetical protein Ae201684P_017227 [Aphanomyces euteiches]